jgi:hypothetical protein
MSFEDFRKSLVSLAKAVKKNPKMTEGEVYQCIGKSGLFKNLGYMTTGIDIRSQFKGEGGKIPDFEGLDEFEQSVFVMEVKAPKDEETTPLKSYVDTQLKTYVNLKKSNYGILTNGIKFLLYKRQNGRLIHRLDVEDLEKVTIDETAKIYQCLRKPLYEFTDLKQIAYQLASIEPKSLTEEANRKSFYETFQLKEIRPGVSTKFTRLVYSLMDLFDELMKDEFKSEFLEGAYKFWKKTYAHKPSKIPKSWQNFHRFKGKKINEETLYKFMFCLETAHNIVAKLILAKVCEDMRFWNVSMTTLLTRYLGDEFLGEARINTIAYPFALKKVLERMRDNLVENVFEEDIFDWWTDCKQIVGESARDWRKKESYIVMNFGLILAKIFFALRSFDFHGVREDILGELYQHYFDPETRKVLGEFYTPLEVVNYILDAVDYKGRKILNRRLLDPACGSGTFIVEALKRYLKEAKLLEKNKEKDYWSNVLHDLCEHPKIIGFDINPFAVLMAQIRFMIELVPYYKRAREGKPGFTLTTIPIFRTDSLEIETKTGRMQRTLDDTISFSMRLPIIEEEKFLPITFSIPTWEPLQHYLHGDKDNYFILLKLTFDVIKDKARKEHYKINANDLTEEYQKNFEEASVLAEYMQPCAQEILSRIKDLRQKYRDGRLIKSLEDLVLAGILKNSFTYDYIVGNPPYIRTHRITEKRSYEKQYSEFVIGQYDISYLFVARGLEWLDAKSESRLGYITSNKFCVLDSGIKLREYILKNFQFLEFIDFSGIQTFAGPLPAAAIIVIERQKDTQNGKIKVDIKTQSDIPRKYSKLRGFDVLEETLKYLLSNLQFYTVSQKRFRINENLIFDFSLPDDLIPLINKIEKNSAKLIPEVVNTIRRGLRPDTTKYKDIFFIRKSDYERLSKNDKRLYKRHLRGEDIIDKYTIRWKGEYVKFLPEKMAEGGNKDLYEQPKIVIKEIGRQLRASYDKDKFYCFKTIHLILESDSNVNLKYLTAILNSDLIEFFFKSKFYLNRLGRGSFRYRKQFLKHLPIKLPRTSKEQKITDEITSLVEEILTLSKIEQRIQNFPESYFEEIKDEIDGYILLKWQAKRSYEELKPVLEPKITEGSRIVLGKNDFIDVKEIDSDLKEEYVIKTLKGRKARKYEEFRIKIPRSDAMVKKILDMYEKDKERMREKSIRELEKEINERVYKLYGLNEEDKKVIEEFLEKF